MVDGLCVALTITRKKLGNILTTSLPKVLILDLSEGYGGASARVLTLMQKYPSEKMALAALQDSPVSNYALNKDLPVFIVGKKKYDIRIFFNLVRIIRLQGFDVLDVQNIQSKFWGSLAASAVKVALVSTLNSWYLNEHEKTGMKGKIYSAVELLTNWADIHYIVVSRDIYNSLCKVGINPNQISLIYNAIDINDIQFRTKQYDIKSKLNIPLDSIICIALGRLVWAKGYKSLIEAFAIIKDKMHNLFCIIVGGGELQHVLSEQITRNNLLDRVVLYGYSDHETALSILKACDIFVMPSRTEGTPIALLEAAALGVPIVATNVGGIPELVTTQEALLVPPDNPAALASSLMKLAEDRNFAKELSEHARFRVNELFSADQQLDATLNAYHSALSQNY